MAHGAGLPQLPTSQPSEEAEAGEVAHYGAVRKYCAGGKNLEWSRDVC